MATKAALEQALTNPNARAFLDMISVAEGTTRYGYYTLFGGGKISSLVKHPNTAITVNGYTSTAAGRYQFLFRTWYDVATKLQLPDFGPHSQDIAALELIARRGGLNFVLQGNLTAAINAVRKEWASFPGAGYGQGERSLAFMQSAFNKALSQYTYNAPTTQTTSNTTPASGVGGTALGMTLPPTMALSNPGIAIGSAGTILLLGGAAIAVYYLFFAE